MVPLEKMILLNIWFSKNPSAVNPEWNCVFSKQSAEEAIDFVYPGYYLPEDRAKRITVIRAKVSWDKESVGKMITDNTSSVAPDVVKNLI
jgi:penicillin amidase